jgi:hypothetical protein
MNLLDAFEAYQKECRRNTSAKDRHFAASLLVEALYGELLFEEEDPDMSPEAEDEALLALNALEQAVIYYRKAARK